MYAGFYFCQLPRLIELTGCIHEYRFAQRLNQRKMFYVGRKEQPLVVNPDNLKKCARDIKIQK